MVKAVKTMDGWYCLHDMRRLDWKAWKRATDEERHKALSDFKQVLTSWENVEKEEKGSHALYQVIGQKADLMFMLLRPTMEELTNIETKLNKSAMGDYLIP